MGNDPAVCASVDAYIEAAPEAYRERLTALRAITREALPGAQELIRWNMPSYYLGGKPFFHYSVAKKHISIHPGSDAIETSRGMLDGYTTTRGAVHLPMDRPLPTGLVRDILLQKLRAYTEAVGDT